jgi:hypothetical protein
MEKERAETHRKATDGDRYVCWCLFNIRDPKCKEKYPLACPCHRFQDFMPGSALEKKSDH